MTDDLVRQEMQLIRRDGCELHPPRTLSADRLVLDLCDELPDGVGGGRRGAAPVSAAKPFTECKGHAHAPDRPALQPPSIILWGLGNEDDWAGTSIRAFDRQAIRGFMTEMRDLAHSLDSSVDSFRRCDFARDIPDVYSPSIWAGWYRGNYPVSFVC